MSNDMKLIMENWRKTVKENAMSAGGVAGHANQDDLNEDNYEDSGEPWDPKSSSYPFQHPQKGLLLRYKNRPNFNAWAEKWKKENPDGQLTKAVRVAPKGGGRLSIGSGVPFKRRYEEELMEGFMDTIKKGAIGGALAMGLAGAPADAQASTPTSGGEQTTQQAQAEYDSTTVTVGFLHAYAKHLKGKPGVELRDRHNITMKWLPIQKAVYDLGPEKALSSDRLDSDQQELLQLVIDKVGSLDAEMSQFYGQIGSGITMNEQLDEIAMRDVFLGALLALGSAFGKAASAGDIVHPFEGDRAASELVVKDAAQVLQNAASKTNNPDMQQAADALKKVADSPEDVQRSAAEFGLSDMGVEYMDYALNKVKEKHSSSGETEKADSGIEGDRNNDGKLSPLELQKLQQQKAGYKESQIREGIRIKLARKD